MLETLHPFRHHVLWRWLFTLLLTAGFAAWVVWFKPQPPAMRLANTQNLAPPDLELPDQSIHEILAQGVALVADPPRRGQQARLDMSFLPAAVARAGVDETAPLPGEPIVLGLVFTGANENFAMINGQIHVQGRQIPDGRTLLAVTEKGILLSGLDGGEWIPWDYRPGTRLTRGPQTQAAAPPSQDQPPAEDQGALTAIPEEVQNLLQGGQ